MEKTYQEALTVTVYGTDQKGEMFAEDTKTQTLARSWIVLTLRRKMNPGAEVIIFNKTNGNQAEFIVEPQEGGLVKAVLKDLSVDIWEKDFGAPPEPRPDTRERIHMVCKSCGTRESVALSESALKRAKAGQILMRHCAQCVTETDWQAEEAAEAPPRAAAAPEAARPKPAPVSIPSALQPRTAAAPPPPPAPSPAAAEASWQEKRTSRRIQMKTRARIRRDAGSEILAPLNVSRGGIAFESSRTYALDEKIFVALHYREGGEILETPGRIVRISQGGDAPEYGVRFD